MTNANTVKRGVSRSRFAIGLLLLVAGFIILFVGYDFLQASRGHDTFLLSPEPLGGHKQRLTGLLVMALGISMAVVGALLSAMALHPSKQYLESIDKTWHKV